ncbi:hypothetical protein JW758_01465 [Candidatus Peregrinibacteria bacterium]|nr:hypothetical protein [Candidatus Peregrinibacteria bacterium]
MKKIIPSTSELIKKHNNYIAKFKNDKNFEKAHAKALKTLKHERLVHLIVTIAVTVFCLTFFALYLFFAIFMLLVTFIILVILTLAYYIYYFKLENTVIKWEKIEYDKTKKK